MARQIGALVNDTVVPVQAEPLHSLEDRASALLCAAGLVGILDAEEKLSAEFFGVQPVEERSPCAADVQISGRRWSEAQSGFGSVCHSPIMKSGSTRFADPPSGERGIRTLDTRFHVCRFSKPVPSASRPSLRESLERYWREESSTTLGTCSAVDKNCTRA